MVSNFYKYIFIVICFLGNISQSFTQISESFDMGVFPPSGWIESHTGTDALYDSAARSYSPSKSALFDDDLTDNYDTKY